MANDVRITINGIDADIFDSREFPLKLDFQIEDVRDFSKRKGSGSATTYRLPATQTNSKIFGLFGRISGQPIDTIKATFSAVIEVGGVPILTGKARLIRVVQSSDYTGRRGFEYEISFVAENADWFTAMNGLTLQDIDWSDLDHEFSQANITAGWGASGIFDDYGYTLIKWKDWDNTLYVTYREFTPFIFSKTILERAFNLVGYTVDSTFINSLPFANVMHPIPLKNYGAAFFEAKTDVRASKTAFNIGVGPATFTVVFDDEVTPPNIDPNGVYNPVTGVYTAPYAATYRFKAEVTINNIAGPGPFGIGGRFLQNGTTSIPAFPKLFVVANGDVISLDETFFLDQGDTLVFQLSAVATVTTYDIEIGTLEIEGQNIEWIVGSSDVFFDFLVPTWSLKDYIKGLTEIFNLYIYADSAAKTVRIETRDAGSTPFIDGERDISQYIDLSKLGEKALIQADKQLLYQYKSDSNDKTVEVLNDGEQIPVFSGQYTLSDATAKGIKEIKNSFFAPTIGIRDTFIAGFANDDTPPLIPIIWPENYEEIKNGVTTDYIFAPRVLYHQGIIVVPVLPNEEPSIEGSISLGGTNPLSRFSWPKSFMVDYDDPTGSRPSLSYGQEIITFGVEIDGLIRTYYINQLASVNNGVQRVEWWRAKITDIIKEEFRDKILISGERYVLQKIDSYNPTRQDSTKIILLEDRCATTQDVDAIESPSIKGVVNNG